MIQSDALTARFFLSSQVGSELGSFDLLVHICSVCLLTSWVSYPCLKKWPPFSNKRHLLNMQVRAMGAMGYVLISSFLIRENILALVIGYLCNSEILLHPVPGTQWQKFFLLLVDHPECSCIYHLHVHCYWC